METPGEGTTLSSGAYKKIEMDGKEVYKFATREVPTVLKEALESAELTVDDVDWLLLHQVIAQIDLPNAKVAFLITPSVLLSLIHRQTFGSWRQSPNA